MRILRNVGVWTGGFVLMIGSAAWAQDACTFPPCMTSLAGQRPAPTQSVPQRTPVPQQPMSQQPIAPSVTGSDSPFSSKMEMDQAKLRNNDRQKKLMDDTQKLLNLAAELKTDVDRSSKDTLSLDVIKKADEIEKLAHSVKEKMKGS